MYAVKGSVLNILFKVPVLPLIPPRFQHPGIVPYLKVLYGESVSPYRYLSFETNDDELIILITSRDRKRTMFF